MLEGHHHGRPPRCVSAFHAAARNSVRLSANLDGWISRDAVSLARDDLNSGRRSGLELQAPFAAPLGDRGAGRKPGSAPLMRLWRNW